MNIVHLIAKDVRLQRSFILPLMLLELAGYLGWQGTDYAGIVTHGASLANLTALLVARNVALPESWESGTGPVSPTDAASDSPPFSRGARPACWPIALETHPAPEHERAQPLARLMRERVLVAPVLPVVPVLIDRLDRKTATIGKI